MTGGRMAVEAGKLTFLVGGNELKLKKLEPDLKAISEKVVYFGKTGSGMRYKLLLNMLQAIHIAGFGEVMKVAKKSGLDISKVGNALAERPGGIITNLAWKGYQKAPRPINFSIAWISKDLGYAKKLGKTINTPLLDDVIKKYTQVISKKMANGDWTEINRI